MPYQGFSPHRCRRQNRPGIQHRNQPQGGLAPETLRVFFGTLSAFFSWAEADGLLNAHKLIPNVERPRAGHKKMRILSEEEVVRLLALLDKRTLKKRTLYVAFSLIYRLDPRISEVCDARLSDLSLKQGWLLVRGKGKRQRMLPVRNGLENMLERYIREVTPRVANGCDRLLVSYVGKPVRPGPLRKSFARYAETVGVVATPHVLRHTFATRAVRSGVSPFVPMKLLGHADLKTTMGHVDARAFDDVAAALDKLA